MQWTPWLEHDDDIRPEWQTELLRCMKKWLYKGTSFKEEWIFATMGCCNWFAGGKHVDLQRHNSKLNSAPTYLQLN